jgi:transposase
MAATIDAPAKCELRSVIRFLQAEGRSAAEIHRRMSKVYGENFMSDGSVREWCRKFKEGRTDVHDEGGHGRKSVATVGLVERVDQVVRGKRRFTISELSEEFPEISRSALYTIVSKDLGYRMLCAANDELQDAVKTYLSSLAANVFAEGIEKLVSLYDKCLNILASM